jgi:hypothetical protein
MQAGDDIDLAGVSFSATSDIEAPARKTRQSRLNRKERETMACEGLG